jgi:hypothetical protein
VKTSKAVLAAGLMAGLAAVPLTASAASAPAAPSGSASAAALQVTVSLQPLKTIVDPALGALPWQTLTGALNQLQAALCSGAVTTACPATLKLPTSLPDSLTVRVAQAEDNATLNSAATDIVGGKSDSTPLYTDWSTLNFDIDALESTLSNFINNGASVLATGNVTQIQQFLAGAASRSINLDLGPLGTASFDLRGTVAAADPGKAYDSATAVSIQNIGNGIAATPGMVTVDPFEACAAGAAQIGSCVNHTGAQASADNSLVAVKLPALLTSANTAALTSLSTTLHNLINTLTQAIANPNSAGSILSGAASSLPSALQGPVSTIGGLLGGATSTVGGTVTAALPLDALKLWDTQLSGVQDALTNLISVLANLDLPDISNLLTSAEDIATSKTTPLAGGGINSTATATLGSVSFLPIGATLSGVLNNLITTAKLPLSQVSSKTALISVDGITSTAQTQIGGAKLCDSSNGASGYACGSAGLRTVSVLGQTIDLDKLTSGIGLAPGKEWKTVVSVPTLGAVTLDITRGVPQIVADTDSYREVHMAALDVRLINGAYGCAGASNCSDPLGGLGNLAGATNTSANTANGGSGFQALGSTGSTLFDLSAPISNSAVSLTSVKTPLTNCCENQAGLQKTGVFGGSAIPAGLILIAVAISLRLLPNLRLAIRRVR